MSLVRVGGILLLVADAQTFFLMVGRTERTAFKSGSVEMVPMLRVSIPFTERSCH